MYIILQRTTGEENFKELVRDLKNFFEVKLFVNGLKVENMNDEETRIIYYERKDEFELIKEEYNLK